MLWNKIPERRKELGRSIVNEMTDIMMAKVATEEFELWNEYCKFCALNREFCISVVTILLNKV